jgi:serine/threonine-protein kinase RsbW
MEKPRIVGNAITIPSGDEFLVDVDAFVEGTLRGFGIDESAIADIAISVSELVNNAIFHGNKTASDKSVVVTVDRHNDGVQISVADQGEGFDPDTVENPIADGNLLKEIGRGLFITRSLMDKVEVNSTEQGTTVTITKSL